MNEIKRKKYGALPIFLHQFKNPLLLVFIIATVASFILGQKAEAFVIWIIMSLSILLGFWNEFQAENIVRNLLKRISFSTTVIRDGVKRIIPVKDVQVGDIVFLYPGSIVPADIKLDHIQHLEVNESILTGESMPSEKGEGDSIYMGTVITGGTAEGKVIGIGMDTKFGKISADASRARPETEFQKGLRDFSTFLARIAGVTVVLIIGLNWLLGRPMSETILFALTIAMGITPELLPLIVTIGLSFGAKKMAKEKVIVKQFVSVEDLGNMEVLCTDKTGTLTEGKIVLQSYVNQKGESDERVLSLGLTCNSIFVHNQVFGDSVDRSIWNFAEKAKFKVKEKYKKLYQIPFDFENRYMAVVVAEGSGQFLICKGSPEAIIERCNLDLGAKKRIETMIADMQSQGLRTIAVSSKEIKGFETKLRDKEIDGLNFDGILVFSDVPKKDLGTAFSKFEGLGVGIKIITGDSEIIAQKVARDVGFRYKRVLTGSQVEAMGEEDLAVIAWKTDIFARVTPSQKVRIIQALRKDGHTIGYLGDGINDAPALHSADVGISVNTGVDVAKDAASIVLLNKSLGVIADGIRQGRITFQNTIKYVLMGTSSDFGNMVSAAAASVFLPFLPMTPVQVLLTDILYDTSQISIPTDHVDEDQIRRPKSWNIAYIKRFMLLFGPISTLYDFLTFAIMYFAFHARGGMFQTGWFVESLITEILVIFVIRTKKIPFWKSLPSLPVFGTAIAVVLIGLYLPFSPFAVYLGFKPLPGLFFLILIVLTLTYLILVETGKNYLNYKQSLLEYHETRSSKS